jgi:hypothetical protein
MPEKIEQRSVSVRIDGKEVTNSLRAISKVTSELYQEVRFFETNACEFRNNYLLS